MKSASKIAISSPVALFNPSCSAPALNPSRLSRCRYAIFTPSCWCRSTLFRATSVVLLWTAGALIFLGVLVLYLQNKGMLFKIPLKFYDEGVQIQPLLAMKPKMVPYEEISSLELWYNVGYLRTKSGSSLLSSKVSVTSVENFPDKESIKRFVEQVRPVLESKGLKMKAPDEEAQSLQFVFHRDIGKRRPLSNLSL